MFSSIILPVEKVQKVVLVTTKDSWLQNSVPTATPVEIRVQNSLPHIDGNLLTSIQQYIVWLSSSEAETESEGQSPTIAAWSWKSGSRWSHIKAVNISSGWSFVKPDVSARAWAGDLEKSKSLAVAYT